MASSLVDFARPPWFSDDVCESEKHENSGSNNNDNETSGSKLRKFERLSPLKCLIDPFRLRARVQKTISEVAPSITMVESEVYNALQIGLRQHMTRVLEQIVANADYKAQSMPENATVTSEPDKILRARIREEVKLAKQLEREAVKREQERFEKQQMEEMERELENNMEELQREQETDARAKTHAAKKKRKKSRKKPAALPEAVVMAEKLHEFHRSNAAAYHAMRNVGERSKKNTEPISNEVLEITLARIGDSLQRIENTLKKVSWSSQSAARLRNLQRLLRTQTISFGNKDNQLACLREGRFSAGTGFNEQQQTEARDLLHRLEAYRVLVRKRDELRKARREAEMRNPERREKVLMDERNSRRTSDSRKHDSKSSLQSFATTTVPKRVLTFQDAQACPPDLIPPRVFEKHALRKLHNEARKRRPSLISASSYRHEKKKRRRSSSKQ